MKPSTDTVRPGTPVLIGENTRATVSANTIRQDASGKLYVASLEVTWWEGGDRYRLDLEPWEVKPIRDDSPDRKTIGF